MSVRSYALVTVVFESEVELLRLQARSASIHVPQAFFDSIVVVDNTARGLNRSQVARLLSDYGPHKGSVRIVRAGEICRVPPTTGWMSQQVLKLEVARLLETDRYLVLDAKNHFVGPLELNFIEGPGGRPRNYTHSYEHHSLRPRLEGTLRYFALDPEEHIGRFTVTATPFVFDTEVVRAMISAIAHSSGKSFAQEFVDREFAEFFLYSSWVVAQGSELDDHFDLSQPPCPQVWPAAPTMAALCDAIQKSEERGTPIIGVHRKALARMDDETIAVLCDFWVGRSLFADRSDALRFVARNRRSFLVGEWRRRARESRYIIRRRLRDR